MVMVAAGHGENRVNPRVQHVEVAGLLDALRTVHKEASKHMASLWSIGPGART